jgi:hypothetical protein
LSCRRGVFLTERVDLVVETGAAILQALHVIMNYMGFTGPDRGADDALMMIRLDWEKQEEVCATTVCSPTTWLGLT